jgi:hypothetical protein
VTALLPVRVMNIIGVLLSALIGALAWIVFAFVGTPIRKFWDLRGEIAHAMNAYARNISEPPKNEYLLFAQTIGIEQRRAEAAKEFRRLGLQVLSFWENEPLARIALRLIGIHGDAAGRILIELAEANIATNRLGPRRSELASVLRLKT